MELGLRTGKFTAGDWKCSISRISEAHATRPASGTRRRPSRAPLRGKSAKPSGARCRKRLARVVARLCVIISLRPISSSTSRSSGREKLARPPVFVEPPVVQRTRGISRRPAEERGRFAARPRARARARSSTPNAGAPFLLFFFFSPPPTRHRPTRRRLRHREARAAGTETSDTRRARRARRTRETRFSASQRWGLPAALPRRKVIGVVKQRAHLFVVVQQGVVAHAEHVHVGRLARVRRGERKAEVRGREVVARAVGAPGATRGRATGRSPGPDWQPPRRWGPRSRPRPASRPRKET